MWQGANEVSRQRRQEKTDTTVAVTTSNNPLIHGGLATTQQHHRNRDTVHLPENAIGGQAQDNAHTPKKLQVNRSPATTIRRSATGPAETVEAALNRLAKAYHAAMECVGAWHQCAAMMTKETKNVKNISILQEYGSSDLIETLIRVGRTARQTFEIAILSDPIVVFAEYAPAFNRHCHGSLSKSDFLQSQIPILSSTGHKSKVRQLVYLSLVNYADLLLAGCSVAQPPKDCHHDLATNILDRGVVSPLVPVFATRSCWQQSHSDQQHDTADTALESEEETVRRALTALLDAVDLDGSDPVVWLKLACLARRLGRICVGTYQNNDIATEKDRDEPMHDNDTESNTLNDTEISVVKTTLSRRPRTHVKFWKYRRLEKYALEQGYLSLGFGVPPNRLIVQALDRWWHEENEDVECPPIIVENPGQKMILHIELPRYSWSALARLLLRVCREGSDLCNSSTAATISITPGCSQNSLIGYHCYATNPIPPTFFNPILQVTISPLIALPSSMLAKICQYLQPRDSWCFEATCRALAYSIVAARAAYDHHYTRNAAATKKEMKDVLGQVTQTTRSQHEQLESTQNYNVVTQKSTTRQETGSINEETDLPMTTCDKGELPGRETLPDTASKDTKLQGSEKEESLELNFNQQAPISPRLPIPCATASRVSKRILSQQMTSVKRSHRDSRRNSLTYCLLAAILGCHENDVEYQQELLATQSKTAAIFKGEVSNSAAIPASRRSLTESFLSLSRQREEAWERTSDASLFAFCHKYQDLTPMPYMFGLVAHASIHIHVVVSSDPNGSLVLSSVLLECLDLMLKRCRPDNFLIPSWSYERQSISYLSRQELFSVDLLHAELRLKKCEREETVNAGFNSDVNILFTLIPSLLRTVNDLDQEFDDSNQINLKVRCFWLTAAFYLWRARISHSVVDSRDYVKKGLDYIDDTLKCFDLSCNNSVKEVLTPHLESAARQGLHWRILSKSTLEMFRNEIQAASIVHLAREQFFDVLLKIKNNGDGEFCPKIVDSLFAIGKALMERYNVPAECPHAKLSELVDDLISVHCDMFQFSTSSINFSQEGVKRRFDDLFPSCTVDFEFLNAVPSNPCILSILMTCLLTNQDDNGNIIVLLSRLVKVIAKLSQTCVRSSTLAPRQLAEYCGTQNSSGSDDDSEASNDGKRNAGAKSVQIKLSQYMLLMQLFVEKIYSILQNSQQELFVFFKNSFDGVGMVQDALLLAAEWFDYHNLFPSNGFDHKSDFILFNSVCRLIDLVQKQESDKNNLISALDRNFISSLRKLVNIQRHALEFLLKVQCSRQQRQAHQRLIGDRVDFLAEICCRLGSNLSVHHASFEQGALNPSAIFNDSDSVELSSRSLMMRLCQSLLWLWHCAVNDEGSIKEKLLLPVATAIVGLCGSAICTKYTAKRNEAVDSQVSLTEFFDSDASANEWLSDDDDDNNKNSSKDKNDAGSLKSIIGHESLLRAIAQAVHCINHVFGGLDDKTLLSTKHSKSLHTIAGPLLPLVSARVLNCFADLLLIHFATEGDGLWEDYSFGTRTTGNILDSLLYKAYKALHGFTLVNSSDVKEHQSSTTSSSHVVQRNLPENVNAAIQLYRCIMRAYSRGRKSPPKGSLDIVLDALPPMKELALNEVIRSFLFSNKNTSFAPVDVAALVKRNDNWESHLESLKTLFIEQQSQDVENQQLSAVEGQLLIVRRGISCLLVQGSVPSHQECGVGGDERSNATHTEGELSRKFNGIVDHLCLSNISDCQAWHKAAQCLIEKADLIADRLGFSKGFARNQNFIFTEQNWSFNTSIDCLKLVEEQQREANLIVEKTVQCLGDNLSLYISHEWSDFSSLQLCAEKIEIALTTYDENHVSKILASHVNSEIAKLFACKKYSSWQQAWGGLFVAALREVAVRCLCLCLYIIYQDGSTCGTESTLISDICRSLGYIYYSELSGSQSYGYPMQIMTEVKRRELAETCIVCFERAIGNSEIARVDKEERTSWDLQLMVGKCNEKIASTYIRECFFGNDTKLVRRYEYYMTIAFEAYFKSLDQATELEKKGELEPYHGGSCHGAMESFYRLHATRLKCLIAAVNRKEDERKPSELEGLRMTEKYWFMEPEHTFGEVRDRVWAVLSDVVAALAKCRIDQSHFHRSVYRHAQALMWAPILCDPDGQRQYGSLGTVRATRSFQLRGLNYSTNAANSALSVIAALFDKKRTQLCAVWVTSTAADSVFQWVNKSVRKYDSLRGKYISAYIDSLRLCNQRIEIESLLRNVLSSRRDLPSYFAASAMVQGQPPQIPHTADTLLVQNRLLSTFYFLTTVKRQANSALAAVILNEMKEKQVAQKSEIENHLKSAYACFLRLNGDPNVSASSRCWKNQRRCPGIREVIECLTIAYMRMTNEQPLLTSRFDWSGDSQHYLLLQAALEKCKELFPNISSTVNLKKKSPKKKRKEQELVKKSFDVAVPEGLSAGETFIAVLSVEGQRKKVRLIVPDTAVQIMRFSLQVPAEEIADASVGNNDLHNAKLVK